MSLLGTFLAERLVPALDLAYSTHTPEVQEMILDEVGVLLEEVSDWLDSKLS